MTRALQKLIHVGCRELGIDAETRRDLQLVETGKASMSDMTEADLNRMIKALRERGFQPHAGAGAPQRHPRAPRADLRLVHALWGALGRAGKLDKTGRASLNAWVRRNFGGVWGSVPADIDMLRDANQIAAVIEALKSWCARVGVPFDGPR